MILREPCDFCILFVCCVVVFETAFSHMFTGFLRCSWVHAVIPTAEYCLFLCRATQTVKCCFFASGKPNRIEANRDAMWSPSLMCFYTGCPSWHHLLMAVGAILCGVGIDPATCCILTHCSTQWASRPPSEIKKCGTNFDIYLITALHTQISYQPIHLILNHHRWSDQATQSHKVKGLDL